MPVQETTGAIRMRVWEVTYRLPTTGSKYHKAIVDAETQIYANKKFDAMIPSAQRCGGARAVKKV